MGPSKGSSDLVLVHRSQSNGANKQSMDSKKLSVSSNQLRVISCPDGLCSHDEIVAVRSSSRFLHDESMGSNTASKSPAALQCSGTNRRFVRGDFLDHFTTSRTARVTSRNPFVPFFSCLTHRDDPRATRDSSRTNRSSHNPTIR